MEHLYHVALVCENMVISTAITTEVGPEEIDEDLLADLAMNKITDYYGVISNGWVNDISYEYVGEL
jgi:hypothetical protein